MSVGLSVGSSGDGNHTTKIHLISWRWDTYATTFYFNLIILIAALFKIGFHHLHRLPKYLPESCVLILTGVLTGVIVHYWLGFDNFPRFTEELFFNVLLPPVILEAAYSLYDDNFFSNLGAILIFALVGTLINVCAVGYSLYGLSAVSWLGVSFDLPLTALECLIFSTMISAVDPVAVLAIFEEIGVNMVLYFMVFGESLLNDGMTIVIYNSMVTLLKKQQEHEGDGSAIDAIDYVMVVLSFFSVVLGGFLIGLVMGVLTALTLRITKETRVVEPLIIFGFAYFAFLLSEMIHWSGIISIIVCGIIQKRYAFLNASKKTYTTVKYSIKMLSSISDCIIFIFLGKIVMDTHLDFRWGFIVWTIFLITVFRFLVVYALSWFVNRRRTVALSYQEQFILAYGGLRGAVGFSLALLFFDHNPDENVTGKSTVFLTTTLVVVFFTVFVQGGTIKLLVNKLGISKAKSNDRDKISGRINKKTIDNLMFGIEAIVKHDAFHTTWQWLVNFDNRYVKKVLLSRRAFNQISLRLEKINLDEHVMRLYGPTVIASQGMEKVGDGRALESSSLSDRRALKEAFLHNPYALYRNKYGQSSGKSDFNDTLLDQLGYRNKQVSNLYDHLQAKKQRHGSNDNNETMEMVNEEAPSKSSVLEGIESMLKPAEIKDQYLKAKKKYKSTFV
ncbi:Na(+)/H(+) exchanger beta-like [Tigriopus californicus]|nr:Na(+)/H(+) exchanger beta-like [Tigriopus californicus]